MIKKLLLLVAALLLVGLVVILVRSPHLWAQFLSGEDGWICQGGEWVEHGRPSVSPPTVPCP